LKDRRSLDAEFVGLSTADAIQFVLQKTAIDRILTVGRAVEPRGMREHVTATQSCGKTLAASNLAGRNQPMKQSMRSCASPMARYAALSRKVESTPAENVTKSWFDSPNEAVSFSNLASIACR
jgi:hypothetical protein